MQVIEYEAPEPALTLDSIWHRARLGVATAIASLDLPGLDRVYVLNVVDEAAIEAPCVIVSLEEGVEEEDADGTTFEMDGVIYPVNVFVVDRGGITEHSRSPQWLGWRRKIARHLRDLVGLTGVPECWDVRVKPMKCLTGALKDQAFQWQAGGLVARCYTAEPRERHDTVAEG